MIGDLRCCGKWFLQNNSNLLGGQRVERVCWWEVLMRDRGEGRGGGILRGVLSLRLFGGMLSALSLKGVVMEMVDVTLVCFGLDSGFWWFCWIQFVDWNEDHRHIIGKAFDGVKWTG